MIKEEIKSGRNTVQTLKQGTHKKCHEQPLNHIYESSGLYALLNLKR